MQFVDPCVPPSLVPSGSKAFVIAEGHTEYVALPSVQTPGGQVITRLSFTEAERRAIFMGEDVYLTILTPPAGSVQPRTINPLRPSVGPENWAERE